MALQRLENVRLVKKIWVQLVTCGLKVVLIQLGIFSGFHNWVVFVIYIVKIP